MKRFFFLTWGDHNNLKSRMKRWIKSSSDTVMALLLFVPLMTVMLGFALLVAATSTEPVIFPGPHRTNRTALPDLQVPGDVWGGPESSRLSSSSSFQPASKIGQVNQLMYGCPDGKPGIQHTHHPNRHTQDQSDPE